MKCGKPVDKEEREYCRDCSRHNLAFEEGRSVWLHQGKVSAAVYRMKYHNRRCYAPVFAAEMVSCCGQWMERKEIDLLVPIPLHPSRQRLRGFNQAQILTRELSRATGIPSADDVLFRVRKTKRQKTLNDRERGRNLKGAFGVRRSWEPVERVLLVDDIYTTGSTIHGAARMLKKAGVRKVYFLTISIGQGL